MNKQLVRKMKADCDAKLKAMQDDSMAAVVGKVLGQPVTRGQLSEAFKRVQSPTHWKNAIDRRVYLTEADIAMTTEAVVFFTGSVPEFVPLSRRVHSDGRQHYRVRAAGYFATIGA